MKPAVTQDTPLRNHVDRTRIRHVNGTTSTIALPAAAIGRGFVNGSHSMIKPGPLDPASAYSIQ